MKISFCTACQDRLWQLRLTLSSNLEVVGRHSFSLVDYASSDGLDEWVHEHCAEDIASGRLLYFQVLDPLRWHAPRAKNLAHRLADGDYLVNLDADNHLTPTDVDAIENAADFDRPVHQFSGTYGDGSYGRIGLPRRLFYRLGGYDEGMLPVGGQDADLLLRLHEVGATAQQLGAPARSAVQNTIDEKLQGTDLVGREALDQLNGVNQLLSRWRRRAEGPARPGHFATFRGRLGGEEIVIDGFGHRRLVEDPTDAAGGSSREYP